MSVRKRVQTEDYFSEMEYYVDEMETERNMGRESDFIVTVLDHDFMVTSFSI